MNTRILHLCIILIAMLSINMTCQQTNTTDTGTDSKNTCIDPSKINPNQTCTREYIPVCGCDDKTYSNACEAEKAGLTKWTPGKCDDCIDPRKINPNAPCTKEFNPVCGCDGETYSNPCMAEKAGLKKWTPGKCDDCIDPSKINLNAPCTKEYNPVCGCDGKTYGNPCMAEKAGLKKWTPGKCDDCIDPSKIDPKGICTMEYNPVCGCDGKTYGNACAADKAGLKKWTPGECKENNDSKGCIDESKIDPDGLCMQVYEPVCGCDQKTYSNSCEATKAGLTKWVAGACAHDKDCIDKSKKVVKDCPDEYKPVCGCDGRTYPNACSAEVTGVTRWVDGKCQ